MIEMPDLWVDMMLSRSYMYTYSISIKLELFEWILYLHTDLILSITSLFHTYKFM